MPFTPANHATVAIALSLFLPLFFIVHTYISKRPYATILLTAIQTPAMLSHEDKLALIARNHSTDPMPTPPTLLLHFTPILIDPTTVAFFFGLLSILYAPISLAITKNHDAAYVPLPFDASSVSDDINIIVAGEPPAPAHTLFTDVCHDLPAAPDNLFWLIFTVYHAHHILAYIVIATLDYVTLFVVVTFLLTWYAECPPPLRFVSETHRERSRALCNRMLARYPPALVCAAFSLFLVHIVVVGDFLQRAPDLWLAHAILALVDILLIVCHVIDDVLSTSTAHNCRISYLLFAALSILASHVYSAASAVPPS